MAKVKLHRIARSGEIGPGPSRIGGEPIGMTRETWPRFEGAPMVHVATLGREVIVPPLPERVAAVAVFVRSLGQNQAYSPATRETAVVFLDARAVARGTTPAADVLGAPLAQELAAPCGVAVEEVGYDFDEVKESTQAESQMSPMDVSYAIAAFVEEQLAGELDGERIGAISGPHTYWCQSDEAPAGHRVLVVVREALVPELNLAGDGYLYVTADTECRSGAAWWQC